jgi:hypothetical protein
MNKKLKFEEVEHNPVISTCHITLGDSKILDNLDSSDFIVESDEYSYRVTLGSDMVIPKDLSKAFHDLIEQVQASGKFNYLIIDSDGPEVMGLLSFSW